MAPSTHSLWPSLPPKNHGGTFHSFHGKCGNASGAGTSIFTGSSLPELSKFLFAHTADAVPRLGRRLLILSAEDAQDQSVKHRCTDSEHQHWPRHYEQLSRCAGDQPLWLCQDRHTVFSNFFSCLQSGGRLLFSLPLQIQTRSKYAYLSQSLLKGTHEPALQNF